jgi:hypothetical protein
MSCGIEACKANWAHRHILEHDPEKWRPAFRKDHASPKRYSAQSIHLKPPRFRVSRFCDSQRYRLESSLYAALSSKR